MLVPEDANFVETDALNKLDSQLDKGASFKAIVLYGVAGSGKTCLAHALQRRRFKDNNCGMCCWFRCGTEDALKNDLNEFAKQLIGGESSQDRLIGETAVKQIIEEYLPSKSPWIVLFDNVDVMDTSVMQLLNSLSKTFETSGNGTLLITTQSAKFPKMFSCEQLCANLELEYKLTNEEAKRIFCHKPLPHVDSDDILLELFEELGNLPLALTVAASYIRECNENPETAITIADYLNMIKAANREIDKTHNIVLAGKFEHIENKGLKLQRAAVKLSVDKMAKIETDGSYLMLMLQFCASLEADHIENALLEMFHQTVPQHNYSCVDFKYQALRYSLIRNPFSSCLQMHREVQRALLEKLKGMTIDFRLDFAHNGVKSFLDDVDNFAQLNFVLNGASFYTKINEILPEMLKEIQNYNEASNKYVKTKIWYLDEINETQKKFELLRQHVVKQLQKQTIDIMEEISVMSPELISKLRKLQITQAELRSVRLQKCKLFQMPLELENFIGRESDRDRLRRHFINNSKPVPKSAVIVSQGGMGKTQLAVQYVYDSVGSGLYENVLWLLAEFDLLNQMRSALLWLGCKADVFKLSAEALSDELFKFVKKQTTCVVFDNADERTLLAPVFASFVRSKANLVNIIVTTRLSKLEALKETTGYEQISLNLSGFGLCDVKNYFSKLFGDEKSFCEKELSYLNEKLQGLPLAVAQAAAYMRENLMAISEYCKLFDNDGKLLATRSDDQNYTVYKTLTIAVDSLIKRDSDVESVLSVCAYLAADEITLGLLHALVNLPQLRKEGEKPTFVSYRDPKRRRLSASHENITESSGRLCQLVDMLAQYSIVLFSESTTNEARLDAGADTSVRIHRLTQEVLRWRHKQEHSFDKNFRFVFNWMLPQLNYDRKNVSDIDRTSRLIQHALFLCDIDTCLSPEHRSQLRCKIGHHQLFGVANSLTAERCLKQALQIQKENFNANDVAIGDTLNDLGWSQVLLGKYPEAEELLSQALSIRESCYGPEHPLTAITLNNLGNVLGKLGKFSEMTKTLYRALDINENRYGSEHLETATTLNNLGNALALMGDYERQKEVLLKAAAIREKHYGPDHPLTAAVLHNLGDAYGFLGDYENQMQILSRTLAIREKHYGPKNLETATTLNSFALACGNVGEYTKQKELLLRALEIFTNLFGQNHLWTATGLNNLGRAYGNLGDFERQKELLSQALDIRKSLFGAYHPRTANSLTYLAEAMGNLGQYEKQKELSVDALRIREKHFGPAHVDTAITLRILAAACFNLREFSDAVQYQQRAYDIFSRFYGAEHPETKSSLQRLEKYLEQL